MATARIGTSGWNYRHWLGPFYPPGTRARDMLSHYAQRFETVEVNGTFYRLPSPETLAGWRDHVPEGFAFACKASRYITHMKKLNVDETATAPFLEAVGTLGPRLGPVLFQLPPRWRANPDRLDGFLALLPGGHRYVFEFRDETWFSDEIYDVLRRHGTAFCIYDLEGRTAPDVETGPFDYVRLHGPGEEAYRSAYDDAALDGWAAWIADRLGRGRDVYCYFDNDEAGHAPNDALRLRERLAAR